MKFAGYKRAKTESEANEASAMLRSEVSGKGGNFVFFAWDLTMGQKGLLRVLRAVRDGRIQGIIVEDLKDLGRDLVSLIKTIDSLLGDDATIVTLHQGLRLEYCAPTATAEARTVAALMFAHVAYSNDNRKIGIAAARAAGASVGRPAGIGLDDVQEVIDRLTEQNDGALPSVRRLAKELDCSTGKAASLLTQWKTVESRREADAQNPACTRS